MPRLDIPHRMQRGSGYCLPACIEMALAYIGIQRDQNDLARQIGVIGNVGVAISRVMRVAGSNIQVFWKSGEESDLLQALAQNVPPIVAVDTRQLPYWTEATTHVVLLAGG